MWRIYKLSLHLQKPWKILAGDDFGAFASHDSLCFLANIKRSFVEVLIPFDKNL